MLHILEKSVESFWHHSEATRIGVINGPSRSPHSTPTLEILVVGRIFIACDDSSKLKMSKSLQYLFKEIYCRGKLKQRISSSFGERESCYGSNCVFDSFFYST